MGLSEALGDHETRLRSLEKFRYFIAGAIAVLTPIVAALLDAWLRK